MLSRMAQPFHGGLPSDVPPKGGTSKKGDPQHRQPCRRGWAALQTTQPFHGGLPSDVPPVGGTSNALLRILQTAVGGMSNKKRRHAFPLPYLGKAGPPFCDRDRHW